MTAFDQAWDLAKMPLVPGSIRYEGTEGEPEPEYDEMEDFMWKKNLLIRPPHNYSAEFYDPVEDRIIPMGARYYPPNDNDEAFIRVNMDDEDSENLPNRSSASASPYFAGVEGIRDKWRGHIGVHPKRRGKGTAIYDMMAAVLDHRSPRGAVLHPNAILTTGAEELWRGKEEGWPVPDEPIR